MSQKNFKTHPAHDRKGILDTGDRPRLVPTVQEDAKKDDRIARYSGRKLDTHEASMSTSRHLFKVNKNSHLDAEDTAHMVGRYVNCGRGNNNTSFGSGRTTTCDPMRKQWWISIYVTKSMSAVTETLVSFSGLGLLQNVNSKF